MSGQNHGENSSAENNCAGKSKPGVSREQRISNEGLARLEKQFQSGVKISDAVLQQWIKRYGDAAASIIRKYRQNAELK